MTISILELYFKNYFSLKASPIRDLNNSLVLQAEPKNFLNRKTYPDLVHSKLICIAPGLDINLSFHHNMTDFFCCHVHFRSIFPVFQTSNELQILMRASKFLVVVQLKYRKVPLVMKLYKHCSNVQLPLIARCIRPLNMINKSVDFLDKKQFSPSHQNWMMKLRNILAPLQHKKYEFIENLTLSQPPDTEMVWYYQHDHNHQLPFIFSWSIKFPFHPNYSRMGGGYINCGALATGTRITLVELIISQRWGYTSLYVSVR